jgi:protein-S-isoprenylcysteine O-methyltransferase Ste14
LDLLGPALVFLSALAWGAVHSLLAALGLKRWIFKLAGSKAGRFYRLGYNLFAGISLLPVFALLALFPGKVIYRISAPWSFVAIFGEITAILLVAKGISQTGLASFLGFSQLLGSVPSKSNLVTDGIYAHIRHPLYTGGLLFIWLSPIMTTSLLALNLTFTLYIIIGAWLEERKLEAEFGNTYREYRQRIPMFIPIKIK